MKKVGIQPTGKYSNINSHTYSMRQQDSHSWWILPCNVEVNSELRCSTKIGSDCSRNLLVSLTQQAVHSLLCLHAFFNFCFLLFRTDDFRWLSVSLPLLYARTPLTLLCPVHCIIVASSTCASYSLESLGDVIITSALPRSSLSFKSSKKPTASV